LAIDRMVQNAAAMGAVFNDPDIGRRTRTCYGSSTGRGEHRAEATASASASACASRFSWIRSSISAGCAA